ncbi:MAG: hypothetical protein FJY85_17990, partial [Deltaproteobacteria bacterium]|nr:hypothetical protein [Deltaproteobacteria bacterium]
MVETKMGMYEAKAQRILLDKLGYEIWLLDFLAERHDMFEGGTDISMIKITSDEPVATISVGVTDYIGADAAQSIMDAVAPLTFMASYKMIDMIFEWILEENYRSGNISKVPWPYSDKLKLLADRSRIQFPPLFLSQQYLHNYSEALFCQLLPYRNVIVHDNSFSVSNGTLTLSSPKDGTSLTLSRVQIGCLVRFVVALGRALAGIIVVDTHMDKLLRYHLDVLVAAHGLPAFKQQIPLLVRVELTVLKRGDCFPANLKQVRDNLRRMLPGRDVDFDLTVLAVEGENL